MKPVEIAKGIYDVGVIDWNIRDFHGYSTDRGPPIMPILIVDEKITLIDTVKKEFADELMENISKIVDPKKSTMSSAIIPRWIIPAACPGHAPDRRRQTAVLLQDGAKKPFQAFSPEMELSGRLKTARNLSLGAEH